MPNDLNDDRLDRLRGDLAALRARTARDFGVSDRQPVIKAATRPVTKPVKRSQTKVERSQTNLVNKSMTQQAVDSSTPPDTADDSDTFDDEGWGSVMSAGRARPPPAAGRRQRSRPSKPPRRSPFRRRASRPSARLAVPTPIVVRRRPSWMAAPRWPVWHVGGAVVAILVMIPAVGQLAYRLLNATQDTSILLGADPSRNDYLSAASGVAGGAITLALAVAALAVVRGRLGYVAASIGVFGFFGIFPFLVYTATAGILSASLPPLLEMIRPPGWQYQQQLSLIFWLCLLALGVALLDLLIRSARAVGRTFT